MDSSREKIGYEAACDRNCIISHTSSSGDAHGISGSYRSEDLSSKNLNKDNFTDVTEEERIRLIFTCQITTWKNPLESRALRCVEQWISPWPGGQRKVSDADFLSIVFSYRFDVLVILLVHLHLKE